MNKYVGIWYSWGDVERPLEIPENKDAFDYMVEVALKEVKITIAENKDTATIGIEDDDNGNEVIVLNYHHDDEFCYYRLFDSEGACNEFLDGVTAEWENR